MCLFAPPQSCVRGLTVAARNFSFRSLPRSIGIPVGEFKAQAPSRAWRTIEIIWIKLQVEEARFRSFEQNQLTK